MKDLRSVCPQRVSYWKGCLSSTSWPPISNQCLSEKATQQQALDILHSKTHFSAKSQPAAVNLVLGALQGGNGSGVAHELRHRHGFAAGGGTHVNHLQPRLWRYHLPDVQLHQECEHTTGSAAVPVTQRTKIRSAGSRSANNGCTFKRRQSGFRV